MAEESRSYLCPYCGSVGDGADICQTCGGRFDALSRQATQVAMGPWFVRDPAKPFHPGCSYEVIQKQVRAGKITAETIIRGPTTRQFWDMAQRVPGVAHLVGFCHACQARTGGTGKCVKCGAAFITPTQRNELGLSYPGRDDAAVARQVLAVEPARTSPRPEAPAKPLAPSVPERGTAGLLGGVLKAEDDSGATARTSRGKRLGAGGLGGSLASSMLSSSAIAPERGSDAEPRRPRRRLGPTVWALIILNAVALIVIVAFLFAGGEKPTPVPLPNVSRTADDGAPAAEPVDGVDPDPGPGEQAAAGEFDVVSDDLPDEPEPAQPE